MIDKDDVAYIYIMTNETFKGHDWVKIGYATNVEKRRRQLSTTALPYPYEIYATYEIPKSDHLGDKVLHKIITNLNPNLRLAQNREFFVMTPEQAYELLYGMAVIHNREKNLVKYTNNKNDSHLINSSVLIDKKSSFSDYDEEINSKRPPFKFSMCGIHPGEKIQFLKDPELEIIVKDDKHVLFDGVEYTLSPLAKKLLGLTHNPQGPICFSYKGIVLDDLRKRNCKESS